MMRKALPWLVFSACASGPVTPAQQTGAVAKDATVQDVQSADLPPEVAAEDVPVDAGPQCVTAPTVASLETTYFADSCAFSKCHSPPKPAGQLDLSPGKAWAQLVGVAAVQPEAKAAGLQRVVPGKPEQSFLYQKVHGPTTFGALMPDGADEPVDPDCGVAQLKAWIEAGALK